MADARIDHLVAIYLEAGTRLQDALNKLLTESQENRRQYLLAQILNILKRLRKETDAWTAEAIDAFVAEADKAAKSSLASRLPTAALGSTINVLAVEALSADLSGKLNT